MACCRCCCGGVDCAEGDQGKCCCGGPTGTCCDTGEYCCSGVCQASPCGLTCDMSTFYCRIVRDSPCFVGIVTKLSRCSGDVCDDCTGVAASLSPYLQLIQDDGDDPGVREDRWGVQAGLAFGDGVWSGTVTIGIFAVWYGGLVNRPLTISVGCWDGSNAYGAAQQSLVVTPAVPPSRVGATDCDGALDYEWTFICNNPFIATPTPKPNPAFRVATLTITSGGQATLSPLP